jgi:hypothetical protein
MNWINVSSAHGKQSQDEIEMGKQVEMEHKGTIQWIAEKLGGKVDEALMQEITTKIAEDHLKEMPDYYTKLKAMEKGVSSQNN